MEEILNSTEEKMMLTIESLENKFTNVRAGRANPNMLDGIMVEYYGVPTPLKSLANISIPEARQLSIKPFDRSCLGAIEKAIFEANLGVTPNNNGEVVFIVIPPLTEDRRKELVKQVKGLGEEAKIALRNIRQDANKALENQKLPEDEEKRGNERVQDLINEYNKIVDEKLKEKEKDLKTKWEEEKTVNTKISKKKEEIDHANFELETAENNYDLESAARLRHGTIPKLEKELASLEEINKSEILSDTDDEESIAAIISKWTNIPVSKLAEGDKEKLLHLEDKMKERVKGQDNAIHLVTEAIIRSRAGIKDPNRPIGSFIFLGPTGVGKTEVARTLAYELFDDERHMIRIDMSEYMESHSVARLIGAPP